jgi:hypothetical protein
MMKQSMKLVDVVIEVRDARIPLATRHPQVDFLLTAQRVGFFCVIGRTVTEPMVCLFPWSPAARVGGDKGARRCDES